MSYQPKLNLEAVRLGYLGADPKVVGMLGGYQTRMTPVPQQKQEIKDTKKTETARRPNPYIK